MSSIANANNTFSSFKNSLSNQESILSNIFTFEDLTNNDSLKKETINNKESLKELLQSTLADLNGLCGAFEAKSLANNQLSPLLIFAIWGSLTAINSEGKITDIVGSGLTGAFIGSIISIFYRSNEIIKAGEKIKSVQISLKKAIDAFSKEYDISINYFLETENPIKTTIEKLAEAFKKKKANNESIKESFENDFKKLKTMILSIESKLKALSKVNLDSLKR